MRAIDGVKEHCSEIIEMLVTSQVSGLILSMERLIQRLVINMKCVDCGGTFEKGKK
jgi:hypothetical protein